LAEYERSASEIRAAGADLVALSVDDPTRSEAVRRDLRLSFPLLCDTGREVVRAWDLYNPKEQGGIATPTVFVIDRGRRVLLRSVDRTTRRVSTEAVLGFLRGHAGHRAPGRTGVRPGLRDFARAVGNALRRGARTPER
jgi:peroxiredoxin